MYVELKNINKTYGSYQASRNVNFGIEKGKTGLSVWGPSEEDGKQLFFE